ncbi:MAG: hypothetical protein IPG93_17730 [Burkholderiales bacterium]|nr:hypothetical protein [Burkholderiales bacterium]
MFTPVALRIPHPGSTAHGAARLFTVLALAWGASHLAVLPALAQTPAANPAPAGEALELEFWKSVDRIGTPRAYRIYLDKYPNGLFAPLAREAILRAGSPVAPAAAPTQVAPQTITTPATPAAAGAAITAPAAPVAARAKLPLTYFKDQATSGAVTFGIGDRFNGPGPVRVGWGKSNKQVPLPSGEWVALAATDHDERNVTGMAPTVSVSRSYAANAMVAGSLKLTTVALGKFDGNQLAALILVMLNRTPLVAQMTSPEGEACEGGKDARLFEFKEGAFYRRTCGLALAVDNPLSDTARVGPAGLLADVNASLSRMGASVKGPGVVTTLMFSGATDGWMRLQRIDFPAVYPELESVLPRQLEAAGKSPPNDGHPSAVYLRQLRSWLDGYVTKAYTGWRRDLEENDLEPGTPARSSPALPDFSPKF